MEPSFADPRSIGDPDPLRHRLPEEQLTLEDPLDSLECDVQSLESSGASPEELSRAWLAVANCWRDRFGSVQEELRACREAAAADPTQTAALERSALGCLQAGLATLALQYARALVQSTPREEAAATRALRLMIRAMWEAGERRAAMSVLSDIGAPWPHNAALHELAVEVAVASGLTGRAAQHASEVARLSEHHNSARSLTWFARAHALDPNNEEHARRYARALCSQGFAEAAVALLSSTATRIENHPQLRVEAAEIAEEAGRHDMAAEVVIQLLLENPFVEALYEPLLTDLQEAGFTDEAQVVAEHFARNAEPEARSKWLERAAAASRSLGDSDWAEALIAYARHGSVDTLKALGSARPTERETLLWTARIASLAGDDAAAASSALAVLDRAPDCMEAAVRLEHAAMRMNSSAFLIRALGARAQAAPERGRKARALARLSGALVTDNPARACSVALKAINEDPQAADAVIVLLRCIDHVAEDKLGWVIAFARNVLGDSAPLFEVAFELLAQKGAWADAQELLRSWCNLEPYSLQARLHSLQYAIQHQDAADVVAECNKALRDEFSSASVGDVVEHAVTMLVASGIQQPLMDLALETARRWGSEERCLWAVRIAEKLEDPDGLVRALEQWLARSSSEAAPSILSRIAEIHHAQGDAAAEARALVRLLGYPSEHARTLERLKRLYASSGNHGRLEAVLELQLDAATDPSERRERLYDLAAVALRRGDLEGATAALVQTLDEIDSDDPNLTLTASALTDLGRSEFAVNALMRRATELSQDPRNRPNAVRLYMKATTIAEHITKDAHYALRTVVVALDAVPSSTELLVEFERLASIVGDLATARDTFRHLLDCAMGSRSRRALLYRLARWLESAGDVVGALENYILAFEEAPTGGVLLATIKRVSQAVAMPECLLQAYLRLARESPDPMQRANFVGYAAVLCERELHDPERAADIRASNGSSVHRSPDEAEVGDASQGDPHAHVPTETMPEPEARGTLQVENAVEAAGRDHVSERAWMALAAVRQDPSRTSDLRTLRSEGPPAIRRLASEVLSLFDSSSPRLPFQIGHDRSWAAPRSGLEVQTLSLLEKLWRGAAPLFRQNLTQYGASPELLTDLAELTESTPITRAYRRARNALGDPEARILVGTHTSANPLLPVATIPPSLVASPSLNDEELSVLTFRFGQALSLLQPGAILVATRTFDDLCDLTAAVAAAFGPTDELGSVDRQVASLASELWKTMSPALQAGIREDFLALPQPVTAADIRTTVLSVAARAGLCACGELLPALRTFATECRGLWDGTLETEDAYIAACRTSPVLAELVRFSFSDDALAAIAI